MEFGIWKLAVNILTSIFQILTSFPLYLQVAAHGNTGSQDGKADAGQKISQ